MEAFRWTFQWKRKQDRPKAKNSRERYEDNVSHIGEAEMAALDRIGWLQRPEVLCSLRSLVQKE